MLACGVCGIDDAIVGGGLGALGSIVGAFGEEGPQAPPQFMDKNRMLATALLKAKMGQQLKMPIRPALPQSFYPKGNMMAMRLAQAQQK